MPFVCDCEILKNEEVAPKHFRMAVKGPDIAAAARPGQFCMLQTAAGLHPFLRRPMSLEHIYADSISFLYKIEGEGTAILSRFVPEQVISVQGPLGNGFPIDPAFKRHIIVAGGIGVAPFPALAEAITRSCRVSPEIAIAARTADMVLCPKAFSRMGCDVHIATDDGSAGIQAYAHELLEKLGPDETTCVYACGPMIMMRETARVALDAGATCLVSLEAQMACGDGACLGCVVEANETHEGESMVRVCADGPVFDARIINWAAHNTDYDR